MNKGTKIIAIIRISDLYRTNANNEVELIKNISKLHNVAKIYRKKFNFSTDVNMAILSGDDSTMNEYLFIEVLDHNITAVYVDAEKMRRVKAFIANMVDDYSAEELVNNFMVTEWKVMYHEVKKYYEKVHLASMDGSFRSSPRNGGQRVLNSDI